MLDGLRPRHARVGPFYCPTDKQVYIDLGFFDELRTDFGATGGPFAQAYVIAHEYGHHEQDLLGADRVRGDAGPERGEGAPGAPGRLLRRRVGRPRGGHGLVEEVTQADIDSGRNAAAAIGDDRIQERGAGPGRPRIVDPRVSGATPTVVHHGYRTGDPNTCDTFDAATL